MNALAYPPAEWQKVARIRDGAVLRSDGAARIHLTEGTIAVSVDSIYSGMTMKFVSYELAPATIDTVTPAIVYATRQPVTTTIGMPASSVPNRLETAINLDIRLPANSYLQIPPGEDIFLARNYLDTPHISRRAVVVIPENVTATIVVNRSNSIPNPPIPGWVAGVSNFVLVGPAYFRPHPEENYDPTAITLHVNMPAFSRPARFAADEIPELLFDETAYALASTTINVNHNTNLEPIHMQIPPQARVDMLGNVWMRTAPGLYSEMMPQETRELLQDFPVIYAVAPECRREGLFVPGTDCAQEPGGGLEFQLEAGEEYTLREPMKLSHAGLISAAIDGVAMDLEVYDYAGINRVITDTLTAHALQISTNGGIAAISANTYLTNDFTNMQVRVRAASSTERELRVHLGTAAASLSLGSVTVIASLTLTLTIGTNQLQTLGLSYISSSEPLTLFGGGFVGDAAALAEGGITLAAGATLAYGYGARLVDIGIGEEMFGEESVYEMAVTAASSPTASVYLNLSGYVFGGNVGTRADRELLRLTLSAAARNVDLHGRHYFNANVGAVWNVSLRETYPTLALVLTPPAAGYIAPTLTVRSDSAIPMETGYLWQGYVPSESEFTVRDASAPEYETFVMTMQTLFVGTNTPSDYYTLTATHFPNNSIHIRIQPTIQGLNLWGSGLERPEAVDADTYSSDYYGDYSFGSGRHTRNRDLIYAFAGFYVFPMRLQAPTADDHTRELWRTGVFTSDNTVGVEAFARLMEGYNTSVVGGVTTTTSAKHVASRKMAVRVHNNGTVVTMTADWAPVVKHAITMAGQTPPVSYVTVSGFVRVNSGSNAPIREPANPSFSKIYSQWRNVCFSPVCNVDPIDALDVQWMGRHNTTEPALREDAVLSGLMCGSTPVTAIYNMPHVNIAGNFDGRRIWPGMELAQAHFNLTADNIATPAGNDMVAGGVTSTSYAVLAPKVDLENRVTNHTAITFQALITDPRTPREVTTSMYNNPMGPITIGGTVIDMEYAAAISTNVSVSMAGDWFFYMDPSFHHSGSSPATPLQQLTLKFGSDFRVQGPAAILPPFGGKDAAATRAAYAERSYLINQLFPNLFPLHEVYDKAHTSTSGQIPNCTNCGWMYRHSHWFGLVGSAITFDGLEIEFSRPVAPVTASLHGNASLRILMPQPEATLTLADGSVSVIYAGSMIYPHQNLVVPAQTLGALPAGRQWTLVPNGDIIAHVDVSPVRREINYEIRHPHSQAFDDGVFNFAPVAVVTTGVTDCIVEPLGFVEPGPIFDFDLRAVAQGNPTLATPTGPPPLVWTAGRYGISVNATNDDAEDSPLCLALGSDDSRFMGCYEHPDSVPVTVTFTVTAVVAGVNVATATATVTANVADSNRDNIVTFAVAATATVVGGPDDGDTYVVNAMVTATAAVGSQQLRRDTQSPLFHRYGVVAGAMGRYSNFRRIADDTITGGGNAVGWTHQAVRVDGSFNRGVVANDTGVSLLTAYFGAAPQMYKGVLATNVPIGGGSPTYTYSEFGVRTRHWTQSLPQVTVRVDLDSTENTDVRFGNLAAAYHWQPLVATSRAVTVDMGRSGQYGDTTVQFTREHDPETFEALRLPHRIVIPRAARITLGAYTPVRYGDDENKYFTFPAETTAAIVNLDLNSWLSAHPFIGLYQQGLAYSLVADTDVGYTVGAQNDSYRLVDLEDKHVVHYQKSEPAEHNRAASNVPIYTNVWLRLPAGGQIVDPGTPADPVAGTPAVPGLTITLGQDSLINPLFNTYLNRPVQASVIVGLGDGGGVRRGDVQNQMRTQAEVRNSFRVIRSALILPAGATLVAGTAGGVIRNVQAAAMFSLTPLDAVQCPTGNFTTTGQNGTPVVISQKREGVQEDNYKAGQRELDLAHPCAWLDDPENTDGDRTFIYRNRRRYVDDNVRVRTQSNDRTYLLGGRLEVNGV